MVTIKFQAVHLPVERSDQELLRVVEVKVGQRVDVALRVEAEEVHLSQAKTGSIKLTNL